MSASRHDPGGRPSPILVVYATRDGHSGLVAARLVERMAAHGACARAHDLATGSPGAADLAGAALVALVAAVRYGRHLPQADAFLADYERLAAPPPLALASVNLTARKPGRDTAATNPYLCKLIARSPRTPVAATAVAGKLDYGRYRWFDRAIIRAIMRLTGGPTDPRTCVVYTAWDAVDAFAGRLVALSARAGGCAGRSRRSASGPVSAPGAPTF